MSDPTPPNTEADWKRQARDGDYMGAIRTRRNVRGESLSEARHGVDEYLKTLPPEEILNRMSDGRAIELLRKYEGRLYDDIFENENEHRELHLAIDHIDNRIKRMIACDAGARTGPIPPASDIEYAGHHWLEELDEAGRSFGHRVMQWQPGSKTWCHSGQISTGNSVDTRCWVYVAACPLPPLRRA